jgi:hypothetical protein
LIRAAKLLLIHDISAEFPPTSGRTSVGSSGGELS